MDLSSLKVSHYYSSEGYYREMLIILIEVWFTCKYLPKYINKGTFLIFLLDFQEKNKTEFSCRSSCHNWNTVLMLNEIGLGPVYVYISFSKFATEHPLRRNTVFTFAFYCFYLGILFTFEVVYDKIKNLCTNRPFQKRESELKYCS